MLPMSKDFGFYELFISYETLPKQELNGDGTFDHSYYKRNTIAST